MNSFAKASILTLAVGGVFAAAATQAAVTAHGLRANAPARCQAFTPGPSNTIRNRVVGSENIGAPIAVACAFEKPTGSSATLVTSVTIFFSTNDGTPKTINCTMLTGYQGQGGAIAINKSVTATTATAANGITWSGADRVPAAPDLGNHFVGVNCTLPTSAVMNDTYVNWNQEDGVGA